MAATHNLTGRPAQYDGRRAENVSVGLEWACPLSGLIARLENAIGLHLFSGGVRFTNGGHAADYTPPIGGICIVPKEFLGALQNKYPLTLFLSPSNIANDAPETIAMGAIFEVGGYMVFRVDGLTFDITPLDSVDETDNHEALQEVIRTIEGITLKGAARLAKIDGNRLTFAVI